MAAATLSFWQLKSFRARQPSHFPSKHGQIEIIRRLAWFLR